jgi:hypothetical protein
MSANVFAIPFFIKLVAKNVSVKFFHESSGEVASM